LGNKKPAEAGLESLLLSVADDFRQRSTEPVPLNISNILCKLLLQKPSGLFIGLRFPGEVRFD